MNNKRSATRPGGYSMVELLVAASVAATLASLAVPALSAVVLDNRRAAVVNELMATVMLARSEAAKRGSAIVICGLSDANGNHVLDADERRCTGRDWSDGWIAAAWSDGDGDDTVDAGELGMPLRYYLNDYGDVTVQAGPFMATPAVGPAGTAVLKPFARRSANGTITVCDRRGPGKARLVIIAPSGRTRLADRRSGGSPPTCP